LFQCNGFHTMCTKCRKCECITNTIASTREMKKINTSTHYNYTWKCFPNKLLPIEEITSDWCLYSITSWTNPHTRRSQTRFLKMALAFFRMESLMDGIKIKSIKSNVASNDLITREEFTQLMYACDTDIKRAMLEFFQFTGCRSIELLRLRGGDILVIDELALVILESERNTQIIPVPIDDLSDFIYHYSLSADGRPFKMHPTTLHRWFHSIYVAAGVRKRRQITHIFRHTKASILAQELTEPLLRQYVGWSPRSNNPFVCIHLNNKSLISHFQKKLEEDILGGGLISYFFISVNQVQPQ
jgi:integrase